MAIAVSGGVDSMTLAHVAHARSAARAEMFHAVSPGEVKMLYTTFVGQVVLAATICIDYLGMKLALRITRLDI